MPNTSRALLVAGLTLASLMAVSPASAAPVTVDLRIEGATSTIFEGPVTADVAPFRFTALDPNNPSSDTDPHQCDGTAAGGGGSSSSAIPVRGSAIMAAVAQGLTSTGQYFSFGPSFSTINGTDVTYNPSTFEFLAEYKNFQFASVGACADPIANGDQVLFAYNDGAAPLLKLTGPTTLKPGETGSVTVTDGGTAAAVAGASVGGATTAADGTATVGPFTQRGPQPLKATKTGSVRSNRLALCVTDGADGFCGTTKPGDPPPAPTPTPAPCVSLGNDGLCGTTDTRPPGGSIGSVKEQQRFAKGKGPRSLSGTATDAQGVRKVRLRLSRTNGKTCQRFDGARERFVTTKKCGAGNATFFEAGTSGDWSYLLPSALGKGRYVLDVEATDGAGNVDKKLERGRNRVVFFVS